jgi:hypothetical protein
MWTVEREREGVMRLEITADKDPYYVIPNGGAGPGGEARLWPGLLKGGGGVESMMVSPREWERVGAPGGPTFREIKKKRDEQWASMSGESEGKKKKKKEEEEEEEEEVGGEEGERERDGDDDDDASVPPPTATELAQLREIERAYRERVGVPSATSSDIMSSLFTTDTLCNLLYTLIGSLATVCLLNAFLFVSLTGTDPLGATTDLVSRPDQLILTHEVRWEEVEAWERRREGGAEWGLVYTFIALSACMVGLSWKLKDLLTNYRCWEFLALQLPCALAAWIVVQVEGVPMRLKSGMVAGIYLVGMGQYVVRGVIRAMRKLKKWRRKRERRARTKKVE